MVPIPITLPGSQKGFLSGNLGTGDALSAFTSSIDDAYRALVEKALKLLNDDVQMGARIDPSWAPLAPYIIAAYTDGEFFFTLVGNEVDESTIEALEYGSPGNTPAPLLRRTLLRNAPAISKLLQLEVV